MLVPVFSLCLLVGAVTRAGARPPNVLLLMPDQWRYDWDGLHTDDGAIIDLRLPNLRALQTRGTRFTQAYVPSPVCAPSRSCMASLREYDFAGTATNGANDYDVSIPTYFSALQAAGYHTMTTGKDDLTKKTQLGYSEGHDTRNASATYHQRELGFSDAIRFCGKQDVVQMYPAPHEPYGYMLNATSVALENGTRVNAFAAHHDCIAGKRGALCDASSYPAELYEDDWTAANAAALLARAPADAPWFLWVSFPGPHAPFATTAAMADSVAGRAWPRATDSATNTTCAGAVAGEPGLGNARCNYAAELENLDRLFGVVLDAAARRGASLDAGNLLVCAFSDHGELLDDHDDEGKSKPWQGAVGVPLVCAGPGVVANATIDAPAATVDVGATVLDFAGARRDGEMTAVSFRGLLEGADVASRNRTVVRSGLQADDFGVAPANQSFAFRVVVEARALADGSERVFKYVCCAGACPGSPSTVSAPDDDGYTRLLYDTVADPFDMTDLKAVYPEIAEAMREHLPTENLFDCAKPAYAP